MATAQKAEVFFSACTHFNVSPINLDLDILPLGQRLSRQELEALRKYTALTQLSTPPCTHQLAQPSAAWVPNASKFSYPQVLLTPWAPFRGAITSTTQGFATKFAKLLYHNSTNTAKHTYVSIWITQEGYMLCSISRMLHNHVTQHDSSDTLHSHTNLHLSNL